MAVETSSIRIPKQLLARLREQYPAYFVHGLNWGLWALLAQICDEPQPETPSERRSAGGKSVKGLAKINKRYLASGITPNSAE